MDGSLESLLPKCNEILSQEDDVESVLSFLRQRGCSKLDSIKALIILKGLNLADAKRAVHLSHTWEDVRQRDEEFEMAFWTEFTRLIEETEHEQS